jgi:hypothetical protein
MIEILALLFMFIVCMSLGGAFLIYVKETNKQITQLTKALKANSFSDMMLIDEKKEEPKVEEQSDIVPITSLTDEEWDKTILASNEK